MRSLSPSKTAVFNWGIAPIEKGNPIKRQTNIFNSSKKIIPYIDTYYKCIFVLNKQCRYIKDDSITVFIWPLHSFIFPIHKCWHTLLEKLQC